MTERAEVSVFEGAGGEGRVRCDSPGERAVSAPIGSTEDALKLARDVAFYGGLQVDDTVDGQITITIPAGS